MNRIDTEYEDAIRVYFERYFVRRVLQGNSDEEKFKAGKVTKAFTNQIIKQAPEGFMFSTPMFAWWDLTSACNFRCIHCLYNDGEYTNKYDLTPEEAQIISDELINDMGITEVILSGGEIFLRPDIIDIVKKFKANNVAVRLLTNAALITDEQIEILGDLFSPYCDNMQISLDGATDETYGKIRRTNLFPKVISNIKKLVSKNINIHIATTVNTVNYHEILDVYKLCNDIGVNIFMPGKMLCSNDSHRALALNIRDLILLTAKLIQMEPDCKTHLKSGLFTILELLNLPEAREVIADKKYEDIFAAYNKPLPRSCHRHDRISIKPNGNVYMCTQAGECEDAKLGNVKENSLLEIWELRFDNVFFQPRLIENMVCRDCKYNGLCNGGCMVKAYEYAGSINACEAGCNGCF